MDKDSNKIVPYITKEEFQNKIKAKYHSQAELNSAFDEAKRNGSFFQLMTAAGKKAMWHTIEGDNVQAEDILKQFSRGAIKSAKASEVPQGAIVLKEKKSHPLSLSNLAIGAIVTAQMSMPTLMVHGVGKTYEGWENVLKEARNTIDTLIDKVPQELTNQVPDYSNVLVQHYIQSNKALTAANLDLKTMGAIAAVTAAAALLSKKPWSAASKFTFADGKALDRANDLIKETAQLMDKEFLERKQTSEKRYYIDEDSVKAYVTATPAATAKLGPDDMLDGSNQIYVKETTKKIPDGAIEVKLDPELPPETNPYSFPSDEAWDQCKNLISKTLAQNRETEHGKHITAAAR